MNRDGVLLRHHGVEKAGETVGVENVATVQRVDASLVGCYSQEYILKPER